MSGNPRKMSEGKRPGQNFRISSPDWRYQTAVGGSSAGRPKVDRATGRVDRRALRGGTNDAGGKVNFIDILDVASFIAVARLRVRGSLPSHRPAAPSPTKFSSNDSTAHCWVRTSNA